jgi:DNA-binding MarR family transcriptional regulator
MIERLIAKKLVIRADSKEDGRAMRLALSPTGRKLVPVLAKEADDNDHAFFKALSSSDRERFLKTITDLLQVHGWSAATHGRDRME